MQKQRAHKPFADSVDIIRAGHHLVPEISRSDIRSCSFDSAASRALVEKANRVYAGAPTDRRMLIDKTLDHYAGKAGLLGRAGSLPARVRQLLRGYPPEWAYLKHDELKGLDGFYAETIRDIRRGRITSGFCKVGHICSAGGSEAGRMADALYFGKGREASTDEVNNYLQSLSSGQREELVGRIERKRGAVARRISFWESAFPKLKAR